jgi:diguanylate cyclase (GGDEF)-like protein
MSEQRPPTTRSRVLIVDDDPVVRLLAGRTLATAGFEVEEVADGRQALESIARARPGLVLLDVEMPVMDGFETCAAIRRTDPEREIPVLIATGFTDSETIDRAFEAGATDFVEKPLDWQILQHRVRFLMRASHAFRSLRETLVELRESEERLSNAQRLARLGHWELHPASGDMLWSEGLYRILGLEVGPSVSTYSAFLNAVHPEDRPAVEKALASSVAESAGWSLDHRIVLPSGEERIVHQQAEVEGGPEGGAERITGTVQDISDRRRAEEQIHYLANFDTVTALPNRMLLARHLTSVLERARSTNDTIALLYLDLDRFKRINESFGHATGDELLKAVASRLVGSVRMSDYVGRAQAMRPLAVSRMGGDEFTVVLSEIHSAVDAGFAARRVVDLLRTPFIMNDERVVMTASIGIAVFPADAMDAEELLRNAATAMHHAKAGGGDGWQFFDDSMNARAARNLHLENALRSAIDDDELLLHYQPQFLLETGAVTAVEALVRWCAEGATPMLPGEFIPLAEEVGMIGPIGEWVLRAACAQTQAWRGAGLPPVRIAVNVSSHQVRRPGLVQAVERALRDSGLAPDQLELELTESAFLHDEPKVIEVLSALKRLGVRLALDDFGTGYSSLSHLVGFSIDAIKIDRSFVAGIGSDRNAEGVIAAVLAMAKRLGLFVTAEGVETEVQRAFLKELGCDAVQGFLLGRPVEPGELAKILRTRRR